MQQKAIVLAHYLPQFHPVPENDEWWEKGFTEWTNTVKAKPLFAGHVQPNLPADLGYYDLRVAETRQEQANLARAHGITGFAYWHYWFGNGKRILERPFDEVLASGNPDFPFCLSWANETWTGVWHGLKDKVLIEQTYPGEADYIRHFMHILPAFNDKRYIRIGNKPLFIVYLPHLLPDAAAFTRKWNELAREHGFDGIYFLGIHYIDWDHKAEGFDEKSVHPLPQYVAMFERNPLLKRKNKWKNRLLRRLANTYDYADLTRHYDFDWLATKDSVPSVLPNWDNTPRSGRNGYVVHGSTPGLFRDHFETVLKFVFSQATNPNNIVLLKSWNEWAEGNYLEPDRRWGTGYLEAIRDALRALNADSAYIPQERSLRQIDFRCRQTWNDKWLVEAIFKGKRNGFFIEAGGADGITESSTYILEQQFGWRGVIAEPCREFFDKLVKNRSTECIHAALSDTDGVAPFIVANDKYLSGLEATISPWHKDAVNQEGCQVREVETISISTLLKRCNCPKVIDLVHLDIEGAEMKVIQHFPFEEYTVRVFIVEISDGMIRYELLNRGFVEVKNEYNTESPWEAYFINSRLLGI